jgi:hypothetical protein
MQSVSREGLGAIGQSFMRHQPWPRFPVNLWAFSFLLVAFFRRLWC